MLHHADNEMGAAFGYMKPQRPAADCVRAACFIDWRKPRMHQNDHRRQWNNSGASATGMLAMQED